MHHATLPCPAQHTVASGDLLLDEAFGGGGAALHHLAAKAGARCAAIGCRRRRFRGTAACRYRSKI